ncbi:uncharacterized protein LOC119746072 [Patiria miniata]|uniref:Methyltransferase domain-containing protein n=1 Tax=Patiria miniata TaxID=46514 RepID=A0A914BRJ3_PATMI|nr:uncharacterized protein LOC119746072 [Patiria miniata]XP_038078784.1 uncharacterized protein LOC119746072 [Patiria miniata]XP_038078785.1 uncharacterized protein LOC119746072 [Patiria miniata]XP_038078786.1 uncharacterized protein LOC119746072 [Patiria miniata]XP_038078787.1 uncharacterized protein LOC119746072 [Patiria miniata]
MATSNSNCNSSSAETKEDFIARISERVVSGLNCISLAMGIETGLFKVMIDLGEPKTCQEIADAGNYKERYVREWLASMAATDIVVYDAPSQTYWLPPHHHCADGSLKATAMVQAIPNLCAAFFDVAECFKKDGPPGVSYDKYGKFDELMTAMNQVFFREHLVQNFFPTMPKVYQQLQQGIQVLEIGCSQGVSTRVIAEGFPKCQVYGIDITEDGIRHAQQKAKEMGLGNVQFLCLSGTVLPADWSDKFDFVFMHNVLHDLPHPMKCLHEIYRVLKTGGTLSVIDTASYSKLEDNLSKAAAFTRYASVLSMMNCVPTSLSAEGGIGLGALWGREKAMEMMQAAHFEIVAVSPLATRNSLNYQCQKV